MEKLTAMERELSEIGNYGGNAMILPGRRIRMLMMHTMHHSEYEITSGDLEQS